MYESLCTDAKCSKRGEVGCTMFTMEGVLFRMKQGYCPVPDFPRKEKEQSFQRVGQQKGKVKKKKGK